MKVTGTATLNAPRDAVWQALQDPDVLVRTIPGCRELRAVGDDRYEMTLTAGVASIKGIYAGSVQLADQTPPESYTLVASGQGAPGTVQAQAKVRLSESDGGRTVLDYDADAVVGGMIGGVGQRVLVGVAKKTAAEFFTAVDRYLAGEMATPPMPREPADAAPEGLAPAAPAAPAGRVFRAPAPAPVARNAEFFKGAVFGALVALAGVAVGALVGRRR
jgi:carbon monoxide dehydrogenase subunit G